MIVVDIIRIIAAFILILFLPGFFLVMALFPKKNELSEEDDWLYRIVLSVVLSIVISIILAFIIGQFGVNEETGKGYFTAPVIIASLTGICIVLFVIGIIRGAYPIIFTPRSDRVITSLPKEKRKGLKKKMERYRELELEVKKLRSNLENDLSYKAKKKFKEELKEKEEDLEKLSKELKIKD
jgi:uncharacterized membrane protein